MSKELLVMEFSLGIIKKFSLYGFYDNNWGGSLDGQKNTSGYF